jgi:acyl carrier protein
MTSIEDQIRAHVTTTVGLATAPGDDDRLAERGFLPSVRLLDLVGYLEDTFGVHLRPVDLVPEKLATIGLIAEMVRGRLTASRR